MDSICDQSELESKESFFANGIGPFKQALIEQVSKYKENWYIFCTCPKRYHAYYVYFVKKYVATLDRKSQIAYYHYISGLPKHHTSVLLRMSNKQIDHILDLIHENAIEFFEQCDVFNKDASHIMKFYNQLLNPDIDDEEIAEKFDQEVATIKIARVFALQDKERYAP